MRCRICSRRWRAMLLEVPVSVTIAWTRAATNTSDWSMAGAPEWPVPPWCKASESALGRYIFQVSRQAPRSHRCDS